MDALNELFHVLVLAGVVGQLDKTKSEFNSPLAIAGSRLMPSLLNT